MVRAPPRPPRAPRPREPFFLWLHRTSQAAQLHLTSRLQRDPVSSSCRVQLAEAGRSSVASNPLPGHGAPTFPLWMRHACREFETLRRRAGRGAEAGPLGMPRQKLTERSRQSRRQHVTPPRRQHCPMQLGRRINQRLSHASGSRCSAVEADILATAFWSTALAGRRVAAAHGSSHRRASAEARGRRRWHAAMSPQRSSSTFVCISNLQ